MKHFLLGTTALVAAGLTAGPATAQEGVRLGLGGFYFGGAGGNIDEEGGGDRNDVDFKQSVEVHFTGETTLDNGLTVGARAELEAQEHDDQIDEVFAYFSGGFGEMRFGDDDDAYAHLCYLVPTASAAFGADSPFLNFSNAGTNGTCYGLSGDATKLIYFTPSFGGLQFAASYAPDDEENTDENFTGTALEDRENGVNNVLSAAATYATDIAGFSVAAGGGASWGDLDDTGTGTLAGNDDPRYYNAYLQAGTGGWTFGGATEIRNNARAGNDDEMVYGVGATYGFEPWTVGLGWTRGEYEVGDDEDKYDIIQFTAAYALGPGVTVDAVAGWNDYNSDAPTTEDYESIEVGLGFGISF